MPYLSVRIRGLRTQFAKDRLPRCAREELSSSLDLGWRTAWSMDIHGETSALLSSPEHLQIRMLMGLWKEVQHARPSHRPPASMWVPLVTLHKKDVTTVDSIS